MSLTIEAKLAAALGEITTLTADRDELRATVEKLTVGASAEMEALKVEAAAKDAKIAEYIALAESSSKQISELTEKVNALETAKVSASKEAAKIVAASGVNPVEISPSDAKPDSQAVNHAKIHASLPAGSKERADYFAKHKPAILSANFS